LEPDGIDTPAGRFAAWRTLQSVHRTPTPVGGGFRKQPDKQKLASALLWPSLVPFSFADNQQLA
jgi:hypothetical protein